MKRAQGVRLFFNNQSILDEIITTLDPTILVVLMDEHLTGNIVFQSNLGKISGQFRVRSFIITNNNF
jgi:hypothetical protein